MEEYSVSGQIVMCLAFPGKIVRINREFASVDYGPDGIRDNINISLVDVQLGSYVLVQGGFAIRVLPEKDAQEALDAWKMIREDLQGARTEVAQS